nr:TonB-dependent receptor [Vibrio sp.]
MHNVVHAESHDNHSDIETMQVVGTYDLFSDVDNFKNRQSDDIDGIFSNMPGVSVSGSANGTQKVYLRGIEDMKANITLNGASQSGQIFQARGRILVEPELLKSVDVVRGAGSALDGFGALGGAIRLETKNAEDFLRSNQTYGAMLSTRYNSNNDAKRMSATVYGRLNDNWSAMWSIGGAKSSNLKDGAGNTYSGTASENAYNLFSMVGELSDSSTLEVSYETIRDSGVRPTRAVLRELPWNPLGWQESDRDTFTIGYHLLNPTKRLDLSVNAYHSHSFMNIADGSMNHEGYVDTYGLDLRNRNHFANHDVVYGSEFRFDQGVYETHQAKEDGSVAGLYYQGDVYGNEDLLVTYGGRYDYYRLKTYSGETLTAQGASPNIGVDYYLTDHWSLRASYAQAFRGPSLKQVFAIVSSPSEALKEERASNRELSVGYEYESWSLEATLFSTQIKDVIGFLGTTGPQNRVYENLGCLTTDGFNVSILKEFDNAQWKAHYSKSNPELNNRPLDDSYVGVGTDIGDKFVFELTHHWWEKSLLLDWESVFVRTLNNSALFTGKKAGYQVHSAHLLWFPSGQDDLELAFSIENIFDRFYYNHASVRYDPKTGEEIGIPASGRDIRLSLRWSI